MVKKEITSVKGRAYYVAQRAKYLNYAKEASATGDRVLSEYNLQYAEHFARIIEEKFPQTVTSQQSQSDTQNSDCATSEENQEAESHRVEMPRKMPIRRKRFYKKPQPQEPSE